MRWFEQYCSQHRSAFLAVGLPSCYLDHYLVNTIPLFKQRVPLPSTGGPGEAWSVFHAASRWLLHTRVAGFPCAIASLRNRRLLVCIRLQSLRICYTGMDWTQLHVRVNLLFHTAAEARDPLRSVTWVVRPQLNFDEVVEGLFSA